MSADRAIDEPTTDAAPVSDGTGDVAPAPSQVGDVPATAAVLDALRNVYDPELGINIVDLGLVYSVDVEEGGVVHIEYTLTTMGCPIGPLIEQQMQALLANLDGVNAVDAQMVLRPPWSPEMMSEEAKAALGYW